jgi:hypothetical protein
MLSLILAFVGCSNPKEKVKKGSLETLIVGSPFRGTNGITWGPVLQLTYMKILHISLVPVPGVFIKLLFRQKIYF